MKINFLFIILMISLSSKANLYKQRKTVKFLVDLKTPHFQFDVEPGYNIELETTEECSWIITKKFSQSFNIVHTNMTLSISSIHNKLTLINGNISACLVYDFKSILEIYEIPDCCPCCSWYNQYMCDTFFNKVENCTTITLFSKIQHRDRLIYLKVYNNDMFLLPCYMRLSHFKDDLRIMNLETETEYLDYKNGTLRKVFNVNYNPTVGLCLNTTQLETLQHFRCDYSEIGLMIRVIKFNFSTVKINSSFIYVDNSSVPLSIHDKAIRILKNTTFRIQCVSQYKSYNRIPLIMCMKFRISSLILRDFKCKLTNNMVLMNELYVNSEELKNGSKFICSTIDPSREVKNENSISIYQYRHELLIIKHFDKLNNKIFKISNANNVFELPISYYAIPSTSYTKCHYTTDVILNLNIICKINMAKYLCTCYISTGRIVMLKLYVNLSISIFSSKLMKSVSVILHPMYLKKPKISGLTEKLEDSKRLYCEVEVSESFSINWIIEFNNSDESIHYVTSDRYLTLTLNNTTHKVCVSCEVSNEVGSEISEVECIKILDIDMHHDKSVQIFLLNSTIWTDKIERMKTITFLNDTVSEINVLDSDNIFIKCVSRNNEDEIQLLLNESIPVNVSWLRKVNEIKSMYSLQTIHELNVQMLRSFITHVKFTCRQRDNTDSTHFINILRTILPRIKLNGHSKRNFLNGQDIHIIIGVSSFPAAQVGVFKAIKSTNDNYYHYKKLEKERISINNIFSNSTYFKYQILITNVSYEDSGEYSVNASNFLGVGSCIFSLERWGRSIKVYIIFASLFVVILVSLIFVIIYCKKSGYTIPIIQIQNNMYTSLSCDCLQLLNMIWPDYRERQRWTIDARIEIKERLGGGNYGVVYFGVIKTPKSSDKNVALKFPILSRPTKSDKPNSASHFTQISLDCFINEIRILSQLTNCPNIIKMNGCKIFRDLNKENGVIKEPTAAIVMEFCSNFSLSDFLNKNAQFFKPNEKCNQFTQPNEYTGVKIDEIITVLDLKKIALGISNGLEYLNGLNIIHRDLATRNILLDKNLVPKICDFGLAVESVDDHFVSKGYKIITYNKELPYKILAPESLEYKTFYLESDIWSFSILLWDIFNLGKEVLFPNINTPNELLGYIYEKSTNGSIVNLLLMPRYVDESIWELIKTCWYLNPFERPSAKIIHSMLSEIVQRSASEILHTNYIFTLGSDNNSSDGLENESYHQDLFNESLV